MLQRHRSRCGGDQILRSNHPPIRLVLALTIFFLAATTAQGQSLFNITSATYGATAATSIPAAIDGVTLELGGTLPTAAQQAAPGFLGCFYTGTESPGILLSLPNGTNLEPLTVPASTIQSIQNSQFTAANGYAVTAYVYFVAAGGTCDGTFDTAITNRFPVRVVAPSLGAYAGPVALPQTNSATQLQAAPLTLTIPANGFLPSNSTVGTTTVQFGTVANVTPLATSSTAALSIPVPAAFSSSAAGSTASLSVCNTFGTNMVCTTPDPAITLTVSALTASSATLTVTPTQVASTGQTVLTAQFKKAEGATDADAGAPAGTVTFTAVGGTVPAAPLVLDTTATFASQTTAITTSAAPTPTITPVAGSYTVAQTITIADTNPAASIYYTQDGSTPTPGATLYTAPFSISTSQTIKAIAAIAGSLNSAVASVTYSVTVLPPTHLGFQVQPVTTALNTAITPAVQVDLLDSTNAVATGSNAAVTLALQANPGGSTLSGTKTVNAVNGIATFADLTLNDLGTGYSLAASSGTLTGAVSSLFDITPPPITMTVQSTSPAGLVGVGATLNGSFTLGAPAPSGGLTVTLSSGTPAHVTIAPATVTVAAGATTGSFTYTGVAAGGSTLSATATGYQTGTVMTTATMAQVSLSAIPAVAPGQTESLALSLPVGYPAPPGGTTVTFTIANTNIATVTQSVFIPAGQFTASANPQVAGVLIGTTTVTASAPGYAPVTLPVTVTVTASFNPGTTNLNLITSTNTLLSLSAPAPAGGIRFNLASDDPTKVTVPASVTVIQGGTTVRVPITGVADGTTTIRATSAGITEADGTVNVTSTIASGSFSTGYDLQSSLGLSLPVSPSTPTTVTVTSNDPTVAIISATSTAVGQRTLTFPNTTSSYIGAIYIQGKSVGTTTLTISAPGYTSGTETVTVLNSGFAYYGTSGITTTNYASTSSATVYPVPLNADGSISSFFYWTINPGSAAINIPITSSAPAIGTVTSPIVFHAGDGSQSFNFTPVSAGTTNLTIGTPPAGFTVPTQSGAPEYQQITATVNTPAISVSSVTTGVHLQTSLGLGLPVAPPSGITVTVTIAPLPTGMPLAATISKSNTVVGTTSLTFTNVTSGSIGTIYVQGQSAGTATITVSAPGYTSGTSTVTVDPSGFAYYGSPTINTTSFSGTTGLTVYPALLDSNMNPIGYFYYSLNPGVGPVTVPITDSATSVGTLSPTSVVFNTNDTSQNFNFQPVSAGTANITLGAVTGFTTPSNSQQAVATVTAPAITFGSPTTGVHLQTPLGISLPVAPPSARTVTITSSAPGVVTLSKDNVTAGTATLTFTNVTASYVGTIYVQGQSAGTATLTVSSAGYVTGTSTATVQPSGFAFYGTSATFSTTTFSAANTLTLYTVLLDGSSVPNSYGYYSLNPGVGPVTLALTDSNTSVGTLSANSVVFNTNDTSQNFTFKPISAGTANLAIAATPVGFSTPSTYTSGIATVTAPAITVGNPATGLNLETALGITLPQTPPNPVTVTVQSNGPLIAVLSNGATVAGSGTLTFPNVTTQNVGTIYVQGVSVGSTTIKVSAPGYTDGDGVITVYESGFVFYGSPNFTTSVANGNYQIGVYPVLLNAGTHTVNTFFNQNIAPSAGTVNVPATSSDTTIGTVVSPIVLPPGDGGENLVFSPVATGTSALTLGTPTGFTTPSQYTSITATVQ